MSFKLEIKCDVCHFATLEPSTRCQECEEITTSILEAVKSIFHDDQPKLDKQGFVKVYGEDWSDMVLLLAALTECEELGG
jgi:hypothetical protein